MDLVGVERVGVERVGVDLVGVDIVGVERVGVERVGVDLIGVERTGSDGVDVGLERTGSDGSDSSDDPQMDLVGLLSASSSSFPEPLGTATFVFSSRTSVSLIPPFTGRVVPDVPA